MGGGRLILGGNREENRQIATTFQIEKADEIVGFYAVII